MHLLLKGIVDGISGGGWGRRIRNDLASLTSVLGVYSEGPMFALAHCVLYIFSGDFRPFVYLL